MKALGEIRFCFRTLAFRCETLYLARRFCGLRDCNVNQGIVHSPALLASHSPGKRGLYAATCIRSERPNFGYAKIAGLTRPRSYIIRASQHGLRTIK